MKTLRFSLIIGLLAILASCSSHKLANQRRNTDVDQLMASKYNFYDYSADDAVLDYNTSASTSEIAIPNVSTEKFNETNVEAAVTNATSKLSAYEKAKLAFKYRKEIKEAKKVLKSAQSNAGNQTNKANGGDRSQVITLVLCGLFFVTTIAGIHRFYLGYYGLGILMLLTFGGCGIWAIIDFIMILTGDLTPRDGNYTDKL